MATPILMPKAGQSMIEGKIVSWLKKEGEAVNRGDPLLEIETDKANLEVEAQDAGVLRKIFHKEGEVCPVFAVIGVIGGQDEKIDFEAVRRATPPPEGEKEPSQDEAGGLAPSPGERRAETRTTSSAPSRGGALSPTGSTLLVEAEKREGENDGRIFATPLARRIARERGVDLRRLRGTGPRGRILRRDVEGALTQRARPGGEGIHEVLSAPYPPPSVRPAASVPMEGMRKAIATALQQSKQSIPHFYATISMDLTRALELKKAREASGLKVSLNDILLRACALALADEPRVNCRVFPDRIEYPADVNIGIAVGSENGLLVPVILKAQSRDLAGIAAESRRVIEAARAGKLIGSGQGTFTVSNLGMFGVEEFTAIINPPEGAILAIGAARTEVLPHRGGFLPRVVLKATLSSDHRAIDGILAAMFLGRLKHLVENPERL